LYTLRDKLTSWLRLKVTRYVMTAVKTMATFRPFQLNVSVVDQSDCRYVRFNDEQFGQVRTAQNAKGR
jgi:spore coat protein U-like protein